MNRRKLRLGMVGGGPGSFIGPAHRMAARMSNAFELCAACVSSNPTKSLAFSRELGIPDQRSYASWQQLIETERNQRDGIEVLAIMTPNNTHHPIALAALHANMHIICDKPLCNHLSEAQALVQHARQKNLVFCVTYNYSAYPMVRQAKAMVKNGDLGMIRQVHLEYIQSHLAESKADQGWRFDPSVGGPSLVGGDIATHAYHLGCFVTGLEVFKIMADLGPSVTGRSADDCLSCLLRFENGARGSMWVTNAAAGGEHGLSFRIFGEKGGLEWHQENPNLLRHRKLNGFEAYITRRKDGSLYPEAEASTKLVIGHPEGFHDAFANLYQEVAEAIYTLEDGGKLDLNASPIPTVLDGAKGVQFVHTIIKSSKQGAWEEMPASF